MQSMKIYYIAEFVYFYDPQKNVEENKLALLCRIDEGIFF